MFENIKYSVILLLNNDVWAVWELPGQPDSNEARLILKAISKSLEHTDNKFSVQFIETIPANSIAELIASLKESIENYVGYG